LSLQKKEEDLEQSYYMMGSGSSYTMIEDLDNPISAPADKTYISKLLAFLLPSSLHPLDNFPLLSFPFLTRR
jgi:hypothetical protein